MVVASDGRIRAHDFWSQLPPADAEELSARGLMREFRAGQALCHEKQIPDRLLVLRTGRVKVTACSAVGREIVLAFRGPGDLVGELSALDEEPRSATIVALEPVSALALPYADFRAFLAGHPAAALALLRLLAGRLRDADAKRIESTSATLERIASRLVELSDRFGEAEGEIALPISQQDLAGWAGASLEAVGRALRTMRGLGWIETRRRGIRVTDLEALRRAAEYAR
jgi:CRP-like cAMP-binding protein